MDPVHVLYERHASLADRLLAPYFRDPALWPVTIVLLAHLVLGIAIAALDAWRDGMGYGGIALGLLAAASLASWLRDARGRRFGPTSWMLLVCWALGVGCAVAADRFALY